MTKKQIIMSEIEKEMKAEGRTLHFSRGRSLWIFNLPMEWEKFISSLKEEIKKGSTPEGVYKKTKEGWLLKEPDFNSFSEIFISEKEIVIRTAWSGWLYTITSSDGIRMVFNGPRRAVGQQVLLPKAIKTLISGKENPFYFLQYMEDKNGGVFCYEDVLRAYKAQGWILASQQGLYGWWEKK